MALLRVDLEGNQGFALLGRALLIPDVSLIFIPEITDCCQDRVGGALS